MCVKSYFSSIPNNMTSKHYNIKSLSVDDRPREKLLLKGIKSLSDAELLAIILGSGNREQTAVELAREILINNDNSIDKLGKQDVKSLQKFKGVGQAKAISIVAALELGKRRKKENRVIRKITSSKDVFDIFASELADLEYETFHVIYLNRANTIIASDEISKGGIHGTIVDVRLIAKQAILYNAVSVILLHNHPSGNTKESNADIEITKKIKEALKLFNIIVLDHVIIAEQEYNSFADNGIL